MNIQALKDGPHCPIDSYLRCKPGKPSIGRPWVPSDQVNVAATLARVRELARMRTYVEDDYADVDRDHHMAFIGGFKS